MKKIKIIVVEPNKQPYVKEINSESDLYSIVYFPYASISLADNIKVIYSTNADTENRQFFKYNRTIKGTDFYSNFVILKKDNEEMVSLTEKEIKEYISKLLKGSD